MRLKFIFSLLIIALLTQCKTANPGASGSSGGGIFSKKILVGVSISSIEIKKFPHYSKDGSKWDAYAPFSEEADMYVSLKQLGLPIYQSETKEECQPGISQLYYQNLPFEIKAFTNEIILEVFDEDGVTDDDNVGYITFRPIAFEKQNYISLYSTDGTLQVDLGLTWNYVDSK